MHRVVFQNRENTWQNALPLGNGCFGAMAFYKDNALSLPMNHYEVYYNIEKDVLPSDILASSPQCNTPGADHHATYERALRNLPKDGEPFYYYRLDKEKSPKYATAGFSGSYPSTGEVQYVFAPSLKGKNSAFSLTVEEATVSLQLADMVSVSAYIAREDVLVTTVAQKEFGLLESIRILYPESRDRIYPTVEWIEKDSHTFAYTVSMLLSGEKPFSFAGIIRLIGAAGTLTENEIKITEADAEFTVLTAVLTDWRYKDPLQNGFALIGPYDPASLRLDHQTYWTDFFNRSGITLPDKFLERIYYINQYALDCSSGRDGVMKHHACGLNGLWDIRHPNLWGSMWYWDVNIQAAFAGVFSSNRLELGKVFSDGLRTYIELAEKYAHDFHDLDGAAIDYPYAFYYSTWPWCAQYLWSLYEYSLDVDYLRNDAYPLFLKLCRFAVSLFKYDETRGEYVVYPDISPEQGPLAHNTVITVASVKYMLKFTLEAASVLGDENPFLADIKRLYEGLPAYPTVTDDYGRRFLDSEDAPANLWIRHPSMLMPIFPTGEIDLNSSKEEIETARNTVTYLSEHCEIGVFQVSWLAAVCARLGEGQKALRLLYEMGIDHLVRSNGLAAEVNERFMNFCLIMRQPLYYPCMMEFTGEMLAAVNEMLMQSNGGLIRVFPAIPDGDPEYDRLIRLGYSLHEYDDRYSRYPGWKDVRFDKLLARGAFEISAELKNGSVKWINVSSRKGGTIRLTAPYDLSTLSVYCSGEPCSFEIQNNIIIFDTIPGGIYLIAADADADTTEKDDAISNHDILTHMAYTKRRIFIGEDADTPYYKSLDSFIRDWYLGNVRMENHTVYKFDFGMSYDKNYAEELYRQCFAAEEMMLHGMAFIRLDELVFSNYRGYGFKDAARISRVDRDAPDLLRRDFLEGDSDAEFLIEAPAGQYELLVVSGDACEENITILDAENGRRTGGEVIPAGRYQCKLLPVVHEEDGLIRLRISTEPGNKWKLNFLMLNLHKQF